MSRKIHEDNYESKARASPRGEVRRKPATVRRGEEHERHRRLTSLGRGGTTQQRPVNRGSGYMSRRCGETALTALSCLHRPVRTRMPWWYGG